MMRAAELYIVYNCEEEAGLYPFGVFFPYKSLGSFNKRKFVMTASAPRRYVLGRGYSHNRESCRIVSYYNWDAVRGELFSLRRLLWSELTAWSQCLSGNGSSEMPVRAH